MDDVYNRASIEPMLSNTVTLTLTGLKVMGIAFDGEDIPIVQATPGDDDDNDEDPGSGACGTSADLAPTTPHQNARKRLRLSGGGSSAESCKPPPAKAPRLEVDSDEELPVIKGPVSRSRRLANARARATKRKTSTTKNGVVNDSDNDMEVEFNDKDSGDESS